MNVRTRIVATAILAALFTPLPSNAQNAVADPPADTTSRCWSLLSTTVADTRHVEPAIQALAALGTMGSNAHAAELIGTALKDPEIDIRVAAILAAGQTRNPRLLSKLHAALEDPEPQVAYTAAVTLWKLHDHAGEDVLGDVASGDRRATATLMKGARHSASRTMHNPAAMAKLGAEQGAALLLGPFGVGISAVEYARRNGGESARATSIDLLAEQHTSATRKLLIDSLDDKDPGVRAAAAKALGQWNDSATQKALEPLIDDAKVPVRLTAAAAWLRSSGGGSSHPATKKKS